MKGKRVKAMGGKTMKGKRVKAKKGTAIKEITKISPEIRKEIAKDVAAYRKDKREKDRAARNDKSASKFYTDNPHLIEEHLLNASGDLFGAKKDLTNEMLQRDYKKKGGEMKKVGKRVKAMGGKNVGMGKRVTAKKGKRVKAMKGKRVKARGGNKIQKLADGGQAKAMESGAPYPSTKRAGSISVEQHQNAVKQWNKQNPEAAIALGSKQIQNAINLSQKKDLSMPEFKRRLNSLFLKGVSGPNQRTGFSRTDNPPKRITGKLKKK